MIGEILTIEDTSGPRILVGGVETFSTIDELGTIIVATLAVKEKRESSLLVDEG